MGFQKGAPRHPDAGKKKGSHNKSSLRVQEKAELLGIDPTSVLLFFAAGRWRELGYAEDVITPEMRLKAAGDVMKYIAPVLKAVEVSGPDGAPLMQEASLSDEQLKRMAEEIAKR